MDNIDIAINNSCEQVESIVDELEKLAIKNSTSLEEEILKYNELDKEELLDTFNISGCGNCTIMKFDNLKKGIEELEFVCCGEDLSCILERTLKYGCKVVEIELYEESENILFSSFNHEAKFKITLQNKYGEL